MSCPGLQALCARRQTESHQFQRGAHLERQLDTSTVNPKAKCMGRVGHFADSLMTGDAVFMSYHVKTIRFDAREIQFQDICSNLLAGTVSKTSDAFGDGDRDRCSSCMEKQGEKEAFHQFLVFAKKTMNLKNQYVETLDSTYSISSNDVGWSVVMLTPSNCCKYSYCITLLYLAVICSHQRQVFWLS